MKNFRDWSESTSYDETNVAEMLRNFDDVLVNNDMREFRRILTDPYEEIMFFAFFSIGIHAFESETMVDFEPANEVEREALEKANKFDARKSPHSGIHAFATIRKAMPNGYAFHRGIAARVTRELARTKEILREFDEAIGNEDIGLIRAMLNDKRAEKFCFAFYRAVEGRVVYTVNKKRLREHAGIAVQYLIDVFEGRKMYDKRLDDSRLYEHVGEMVDGSKLAASLMAAKINAKKSMENVSEASEHSKINDAMKSFCDWSESTYRGKTNVATKSKSNISEALDYSNINVRKIIWEFDEAFQANDFGMIRGIFTDDVQRKICLAFFHVCLEELNQRTIRGFKPQGLLEEYVLSALQAEGFSTTELKYLVDRVRETDYKSTQTYVEMVALIF